MNFPITLLFSFSGLLVFIIVLCAMVTIHEFGHFIVAKWLGIPAEVFSVGFGKRLWGFDWGGTDFRISALPLGGYVRFRGENMEMIQGKGEGSVEEFLAHAKWKRFLVALAGPAFNIITAIASPTTAIMIGYHEDISWSQQIVIGDVKPGSAAEQSGLKTGDRIVSYHDKANPTWADFDDEIKIHPNETIPLVVERNGQTSNLTAQIRSEKTKDGEEYGTLDVEPILNGLGVSSITPDSAAAAAGLKPGDKIMEINGVAVTVFRKFKEALNDSKGEEVTLKIARGQQLLDLKAKPKKDVQFNEYRLGFAPKNTALVQTSSLTAALAFGWKYNWRIIRLTGIVFKQIFAGQRSARTSVAGPIGMAKQVSDIFDVAGWAGVINMMGLLSMNLGIMNLLPIPVLDGGMIVLIFVEALLGLVGMTLTMNIRERLQQVGFVALMALMLFVFANDILRILPFGKSSEAAPATQTAPAPQTGK